MSQLNETVNEEGGEQPETSCDTRKLITFQDASTEAFNYKVVRRLGIAQLVLAAVILLLNIVGLGLYFVIFQEQDDWCCAEGYPYKIASGMWAAVFFVLSGTLSLHAPKKTRRIIRATLAFSILSVIMALVISGVAIWAIVNDYKRVNLVSDHLNQQNRGFRQARDISDYDTVDAYDWRGANNEVHDVTDYAEDITAGYPWGSDGNGRGMKKKTMNDEYDDDYDDSYGDSKSYNEDIDTGYAWWRNEKPTYPTTGYAWWRNEKPAYATTGYPWWKNEKPAYSTTGYPWWRNEKPAYPTTGYPWWRNEEPVYPTTGYPRMRNEKPAYPTTVSPYFVADAYNVYEDHEYNDDDNEYYRWTTWEGYVTTEVPGYADMYTTLLEAISGLVVSVLFFATGFAQFVICFRTALICANAIHCVSGSEYSVPGTFLQVMDKEGQPIAGAQIIRVSASNRKRQSLSQSLGSLADSDAGTTTWSCILSCVRKGSNNYQSEALVAQV